MVQVIISSAFESAVGIAQFACLACAISQQRPSSRLWVSNMSATPEASGTSQQGFVSSEAGLGRCAHGLATEEWFQRSNNQDLLQPLLGLSPLMPATSLAMECACPQAQAISMQAACALTHQICCKLKAGAEIVTAVSQSAALSVPNERTLLLNTRPPRPIVTSEWQHNVTTPVGVYSFSVCTAMPAGSAAEDTNGLVDTARDGSSSHASTEQASKPVCIFLHGFMGDKEDWLPIMRALALTHHCIALDLPGHGKTVVTPAG